MYRKIWTRKILNLDAFHMCMCFPLSFTTFKSNYFQEQVRTVASTDKVLLFFNLQSEWWLQKIVFTISSDLKKAHLQIAETLLQIYLKIGSLRISFLRVFLSKQSYELFEQMFLFLRSPKDRCSYLFSTLFMLKNVSNDSWKENLL